MGTISTTAIVTDSERYAVMSRYTYVARSLSLTIAAQRSAAVVENTLLMGISDQPDTLSRLRY